MSQGKQLTVWMINLKVNTLQAARCDRSEQRGELRNELRSELRSELRRSSKADENLVALGD